MQGIRFFAYIFCQKCKTQLLTDTMHNCKSHLAINGDLKTYQFGMFPHSSDRYREILIHVWTFLIRTFLMSVLTQKRLTILLLLELKNYPSSAILKLVYCAMGFYKR